jgi:hypothetical protein
MMTENAIPNSKAIASLTLVFTSEIWNEISMPRPFIILDKLREKPVCG